MYYCQKRLFWLGVLLLCFLMVQCSGSGEEQADSPSGPTTASVKVGCYSASYAGFAQSQIGCGTLNSFGDAAFDLAFGQEISIQSNFWGPAYQTQFYAFDECSYDRRNALSFPQGYVLFGRHMAIYLVQTAQGYGIAVSGVIAHEWAHQLQFRNDWMDRNASTARATELEADAFSGYYLYLSKAADWSTIFGFYLSTLYAIGDYQFNSPSHHGTPDERIQACMLGFNAASEARRTNNYPTEHQLHQMFRAYIGKHLLDEKVEIGNIDRDYWDSFDRIEAMTLAKEAAEQMEGVGQAYQGFGNFAK